MQEYTYLLRFSDKVITDGQGQNLCGAISATVLYKNKKGTCNKVDSHFKNTNIYSHVLVIIYISIYCISISLLNLYFCVRPVEMLSNGPIQSRHLQEEDSCSMCEEHMHSR